MELYSTILKFFFLALIAAIITLLTGGCVVWLVERINPRLKDVRGLFRWSLAYVSGLIVLPTFYAAYYTNGKTVLWMALVLLMLALAYLRPMRCNYISVYKYAPHLFVCFVLCFALVMYIIFDFNSQHIFRPKHIENYYYCLNVLEGIKLTHVESLESNLMDSSFLSPHYVPYHYFDIWSVGFYSSLLNVTNANSFEIVCPTIYYFGIVITSALVINLLLSNFTYSLLFGYLFLFYNPIDLYSIFGMDSYIDNAIELVYSAASKLFEHEINFKIFPVFLILLLSFLLFSLGSYVSSWLLLAILIIFNINNLSIVLALILSIFIFYLYARKRNFEYLRNIILVISLIGLVAFLILNFGTLMGDAQSHISNYFPRTESSLIQIFIDSSMHTVMLIFLLALFSSYILLISMKVSYLAIQQYRWFFFLMIFALCAGAFGNFFAKKYFIFEDAGQFLSSSARIFKVFMFVLLIDLTSISFVPLLIFLSSMLFHLYLTSAKLSGESYLFDAGFSKQIINEKTNNKIGASLVVVKPAWKISGTSQHIDQGYYYKKITTLNSVGFLNQYSQNYLAAIPLIDLHVPIDTLNPREVAIRKHFMFYNYFQEKKKEHPAITEREAQIMFMKERNIDWVFHDSTFKWPQEWQKYVRKVIKDPKTGSSMVYLKPWEENE